MVVRLKVKTRLLQDQEYELKSHITEGGERSVRSPLEQFKIDTKFSVSRGCNRFKYNKYSDIYVNKG